VKEIRLVAPLHNVSGYAKAGRSLLAAALVAGFTVEAVETETALCTSDAGQQSRLPQFSWKRRPAIQEEELRRALQTRVSPDAPTLVLNPPDGLSGFSEYCSGLRIGYTMLEADTLNPLWARSARNVDALLTPCRWNEETLGRDVPGVPVHLLPLCVDERLWSPDGPVADIPKRPSFLICSVFSTCERKHWRQLMQAFVEEFVGEDIGLLVKPSVAAPVLEFMEDCERRGAWIGVITQDLEDAQMAEMYRAADCYALPSAEGFGMTFVEAMLCGLPIVALDGGGTRDIVTEQNGVPIYSHLEPCVGQLPQIYRSEYQRPTASIFVLRYALRQAYQEGKAKGEYARQDALNRYSRCAIGTRLEELIEDLDEKARLWNMPDMLPEPPVPPLIAVITTHNHLELTQALVASLQAHTGSIEIILADDDSTDGTWAWALNRGFVTIDCKGGNVSANRQAALEYLRGDSGAQNSFVCFFDNDVEVQAGWWEGLSAIFAENESIGVLAPQKRYAASGEVQNVGNRLTFNAGSAPLFLSRRIVYPDYVESACMALRPEVWQSVNFDPQFPIFYEDCDYCFSARSAGWEVAATGDVTVLHHGHVTSTARQEESAANRLKFLRKWKAAL
jgi:GT2 family glycosyltransferase